MDGQNNLANRVTSFEGWSDTVRSALIWLGKADPIQAMLVARNEDPEQLRLLNLLTAWVAEIGFDEEKAITLSRLIIDYFDPMDGPYHSPNHPELHDALLAIAGRQTAGSDKIDIVNLGKWLGRFKGWIVGGLRLMNKQARGHPARWWVEHQEGLAGRRSYAEQVAMDAASDKTGDETGDETAPFSRPGGDGRP